jgi:hypothetical protein
MTTTFASLTLVHVHLLKQFTAARGLRRAVAVAGLEELHEVYACVALGLPAACAGHAARLQRLLALLAEEDSR